MTTYAGGTEVKPGFYWNRGAWELVTVSTEEKMLPGGGLDEFWRVPTLVMLVVAPFMGMAYVMFLPFIGFALVFQHAGRVVRRKVRARLGRPAETATPIRGTKVVTTEVKEKRARVA
jgi:hypothetical protein